MTAPARLHAGHALLAALAILAILLAGRAWTALVAPIPELPAVGPPQLTDRPLLARFDPFFRANATAGDLPVTALPFSLHGLRADSATGRGSAIIAAGDGQQAVFSVGDAVGQGVTLVAISVDHVVLDRAGVREALWLDNAGASGVATYSPAAVPPDAPPGSPDANIDAIVAQSAAELAPDETQIQQAQGGAAMAPAAPPEPK